MSCAGLWVRRIWAEGRYRRPEHNTLGEEKERGGGGVKEAEWTSAPSCVEAVKARCRRRGL